jgi:L-iditol 2-dehydrogenase
MKTAFITGKQKIEIMEEADPVLVSSVDVIIKIEAVGVCGSDIHYYKDGRIGTHVMKYPETIGHECAGTVIEIGSDVENVEVGFRVAIDPAISCYKCDQCKNGRPHTCRKLKFMGNPGEKHGAFSEYIIIPARNCFPIPKSMTIDQAAFVEPLSIGYYAASLADSVTGKTVAILGSGPIGLSTLTSLGLQNPSKVFVTDLLENRLDTAKHYGALWTGNPNQIDIVACIFEDEALGIDYVFECAGEHETLDQGIDLLKPGGTLIIVGIPVGNRVNVSIDKMRRKELQIINVRRQNECVQTAINLIATNKINVDPMLTHYFNFDEIADAFDLVAGYKDEVIKAIVQVSI